MLYTHLNLSFLPIFISFLLFCFFFFIVLLFYISSYKALLIFFFIFFFLSFFIYFYFTNELFMYSYLQFFLNSQFFYYFIVSEVFFFGGVFWSLFWIIFSYDSCFFLSLSLISPFGLALFNTFLLLASSSFGCLFHVNYLNNIHDINLIFCILLGLLFLFNQFIEFNFCFYTISDFSFCSIFFLEQVFMVFMFLWVWFF